jgi:hypothetical protein
VSSVVTARELAVTFGLTFLVGFSAAAVDSGRRKGR